MFGRRTLFFLRPLILRALLVWLVLLAFAFANGIFRELFLVAVAGPAAAGVVSALMLALVIALAARWLVRRTSGSLPLRVWLAVGLLWAVLTAALEVGVFHGLLRVPWQKLLTDYDPRHGYFGLVQLIALLAPAAWAAARRARQ